MNRATRRSAHDDDDGDELDDAPLAEDLDRFGDGEAWCPHCGAEVWDDVAVCPRCRRSISMPSTRPPIERWWRERWTIIVVFAVILGLCGLGAWRAFF